MEKTFIQYINETAGINTLISFNSEGKVVMDKNPENLTPLDKNDAHALVLRFRAQNNKDAKYRVKAAGQAVRDYQYFVLTEVLPKMEILDASIVAKVDIAGPEPEAQAKPVMPEAEPEQPEVAELSNEDIDNLINQQLVAECQEEQPEPEASEVPENAPELKHKSTTKRKK